MRVCVLGIGAVGGYYGGRLAYHSAWDVIFIARGPAFSYLKNNPLEVKSVNGNFSVKVPVFEEVPPDFHPDIIIICTKSYDTLQAIETLKNSDTPCTRILCIQNGIENEKKLEDYKFKGWVLGGVAFIASQAVEPGKIVHQSVGGLGIGAMDEHNKDFAKLLVDEFNRCKVETRYLENVLFHKWKKLMWNAAFNSLTTITGKTVIQLLNNKKTLDIIRSTMEEVKIVANKEGYDLCDKDIEDMISASYDVGDYKTSMLLDLERKKPTENDDISGAVVRYGKKHNISTPFNLAFYSIISLLEQSA
ncbi:MAG: ketopantoate reductase family protein [Candidatus Hydrogenedentota bacterium]